MDAQNYRERILYARFPCIYAIGEEGGSLPSQYLHPKLSLSWLQPWLGAVAFLSSSGLHFVFPGLFLGLGHTMQNV